MQDTEQYLVDAIQAAYADRRPQVITGGQSKTFYAPAATGEMLDVAGHRGILSYVPGELVMTARAGTSMQEIHATLAAHHQILAAESPRFGEAATLGGTIACGLSGPRRAYAGALRDFVLGAKVINGRGEVLKFGGQVVKNVAGFDASRLMVGSLGSLGVLLEVSLKVLPQPVEEITVQRSCSKSEAIALCAKWASKATTISATAWCEGVLSIRLSGEKTAVAASRQLVGGDMKADGDDCWEALREQALPFFVLGEHQKLWRLSLPPAAEVMKLSEQVLMEWGGALRWLKSDLPDQVIFDAAKQAGGYATLFRGEGQLRQQLSPNIAALNQRIKAAFDPAGILNPPVKAPL